MTIKVGFLGPLGTYTHQAAYECFRDGAVYYNKSTITETLQSLNTLDFVVVPRQNSIFGPVIETFDGLRSLKGLIQGEIVLKIQHCLVVKEGANFSDIDCILSHEQALGQCQKFIATHLPSATTSQTSSTAAAAEVVSKSNTLNIAAICSKICTVMFESLEVLEEGIQDEEFNFTRFFIVGKSPERTPPSFPVNPMHSLIRVTPANSETEIDVTELLKFLRLPVIGIDRRPALFSVPFCDTYFLELKSPFQSPTWPTDIEQGLSRLQKNGFLAENMGAW